jgi:hypothetical protein
MGSRTKLPALRPTVTIRPWSSDTDQKLYEIENLFTRSKVRACGTLA